MKWRDISTAPKTSAFILVVDECGNMATASYRDAGRDNPIVECLGRQRRLLATVWLRIRHRADALAASSPTARKEPMMTPESLVAELCGIPTESEE